jgi:hypothetical protein
MSFWRNGALSTGQITVHVELEEIRHTDDEESPRVEFDTKKPEFDARRDSRIPDFSSMKSAEAKAALAASKGDTSSIRSSQIGRAIERQEALDEQQDAQDFSRQI